MINKEKEPDQLASVAISKEEIASRQRTVSKPRISHQGNGGSKALWAVSIFSLALIVMLVVQLQQVKKQSELQLQALVVLQDKLTNTGEQANLSVDAMKIILKELEHEVRKLWDVSNKRNKNDIANNASRLDQQNKLLSQSAGQIEILSKDINKQEKQLSAQIIAAMEKNNASDADLAKKINGLDSQIKAALANNPKNLAETLSEHDKAIKAMDGSRLQFMKRINALEKELKALKQTQSTSPAPVPAQ